MSSQVALRFPMAFDSLGGLLTTTDENTIWNDRVKMALGTRLGERVMRPLYGSSIGDKVFGTVSNMQETIEKESVRIFHDNFPLLTFKEVSFDFDEKTGFLSVEVVYALPNTTEVTTAVGVEVISSTNPPYEELM